MTCKSPEVYQNQRTPEEALDALNFLPVAALRELIRCEIRLHPNFVLVGETGSGKTTCLPPLLLELRNELNLSGGIAVTQPRRVATRSVTSRVAEMMGSDIGNRIGYHIRFEDVTQEDTDITFMTDGVLLRKIQFDPLLREYSIVMIDEAHERSLNIDLCLGLLKDVNLNRLEADLEPIRIIVSSATIERNKFSEFIGIDDCDNSIEIPGQIFPVEVFYEDYLPPDYDFTEGAAEKVRKIVSSNIPGDILIFMPGKKEISDTIDKIQGKVGSHLCEIIPLHSELSPEDQDRIFQTSYKRKIIVSTNVAETSVTIDGIIHVIDSGLIKQTQFDPRSGIEQLVLTEHAIAGIEQRKGRAGRTAPGFCYRLFTKDSVKRRPSFQTPEIQRSNLSQVILAMKKAGIENVSGFDFIDHPGYELINQAENSLYLLGALNESGRLTRTGEFLSQLGIEPRLGRMILEAAKPENNCVNEVCIIVSFIDGKNVYVRPSDPHEAEIADQIHARLKSDRDSDFYNYLNIWKAYVKSGYDNNWAKNNYLNEKALDEAKNVRLELLDVLSENGLDIDPCQLPRLNKDAIGRSITAGLVGNLMQRSGRYGFKKADGTKRDISIHPSSIYFNRSFTDDALLVSNEIFINPQGKIYACDCLQVKREWLGVVPNIVSRQLQNSKHHQRNLFDRHRRRR